MYYSLKLPSVPYITQSQITPHTMYNVLDILPPLKHTIHYTVTLPYIQCSMYYSMAELAFIQ